jgi:hypothetical protein
VYNLNRIIKQYNMITVLIKQRCLRLKEKVLNKKTIEHVTNFKLCFNYGSSKCDDTNMKFRKFQNLFGTIRRTGLGKGPEKSVLTF